MKIFLIKILFLFLGKKKSQILLHESLFSFNVLLNVIDNQAKYYIYVSLYISNIEISYPV